MFNYFFKYKQLIPTEFLLPLFAILCNLNLIFYYDYEYPSILYNILSPYLVGDVLHWVIAEIFVVYLVVQSFFINAIAYENQLNKSRNAFYGAIYILLVSLFNYELIVSPAYWGGLFYIMAIKKMLSTYNNKSTSAIFDAGFWIGVASCFFPPYYWLLLVAFIGFLLTRIFNVKEWIITLVGFLSPIFIYGFILFWFDELKNTIAYINYNNYFSLSLASIDTWQYVIKVSLLFVCFLLSLWMFQNKFLRVSIEERKKLSICLWFVLMGVVLLNIFGIHWINHLMVILPPLSILTAYSVDNITKKRYAEVLPFTLILVLVFFHFINHHYHIL